MTFQGKARTDSYHSPSGPYEKQTPGDDGSVASDGSITLEGHADIPGSIAAGAATRVSGGSSAGGSNAIAEGASNVSPRPAPCRDTCGMYDVEGAVASASKVNDDAELGDCGAYVTGTVLAMRGSSSWHAAAGHVLRHGPLAEGQREARKAMFSGRSVSKMHQVSLAESD